MTVSLDKAIDFCARCGADCAPATSIEIDPLCTACAFNLDAEARILPLPALHDLAFLLQAPSDFLDIFALIDIDPNLTPGGYFES